MLTLERLQLNEADSVHLEEIKLTQQLRLKEIEKCNITRYNKLIGKKIKGFSANAHNYNRDGNVYSIAEMQFKELLESYGINFIHEYQVKVKDIKNNVHSYHLDFYIPELRLAIEVNPLFHYTYETVAIRDNLRSRLLKRKADITTWDLKVYFKTVKGVTQTFIDYEKAFKIIEQILKAKKVHKGLLINYL
jgi:5'(3')-deoxyribonucleotidase